MIDGFLFKTSEKGKNHVALGFDREPSMCGGAFFASADDDCRKVGRTMPLDELLRAHSGICARCLRAAEKQIESERRWES